MQNPKVRIESDGMTTEVYVNGEKARLVKQVLFFGIPGEIRCELEQYAVGEDGNYKLNDLGTDLVIESTVLLTPETSKVVPWGTTDLSEV